MITKRFVCLTLVMPHFRDTKATLSVSNLLEVMIVIKVCFKRHYSSNLKEQINILFQLNSIYFSVVCCADDDAVEPWGLLSAGADQCLRLWALPALPNLSGGVLRDEIPDSSRNVTDSSRNVTESCRNVSSSTNETKDGNANGHVSSSTEYQQCIAAGAMEHTGRIWDIASARDGQWAVRNFNNIGFYV